MVASNTKHPDERPSVALKPRVVKMRQTLTGVEIHCVRNTITGAVADFKFAGS
jgi:hypothetical protein